jgi:hypothetical protein
VQQLVSPGLIWVTLDEEAASWLSPVVAVLPVANRMLQRGNIAPGTSAVGRFEPSIATRSFKTTSATSPAAALRPQRFGIEFAMIRFSAS